jgi:hypothetical protein
VAPERYLGIYMGTMTVCALLWLCSLRIGIRGGFEPFGPAQGGQSLYSSSLNGGGGMRDLKNSEEYLTIGGLSASTDDFNLFVAAIIALALSMALWVHLVWIDTDPGAVRSRNEDFDMVSRESTMLSIRTEQNRIERSGQPTLQLTPPLISSLPSRLWSSRCSAPDPLPIAHSV